MYGSASKLQPFRSQIVYNRYVRSRTVRTVIATPKPEGDYPPKSSARHGLWAQERHPNAALIERFSEVPPISIERVENRRVFGMRQGNCHKLAVGAIKAHQMHIVWKFCESLFILCGRQRRNVNLLATLGIVTIDQDPLQKAIADAGLS